jgi:hypothetical protein
VDRRAHTRPAKGEGVAMDLDYVVLALFLIGTVIAFFWRRTRNQILYWSWLGLMQIEIWVRKERDRKKPDDKRGI